MIQLPPIHLPWRDRRGKLVPIKALALLLLATPLLILSLDAWRGELGPRSWNQAIHVTGLWAERFLLVTLALTPLRFVLDWPRLAFIRRICGTTTLLYVVMHLVLYTIDLKFNWAQIAWEVFTSFYLIIGLLAVLGLLALGVTSTDGAIRRMGPRWKRLYRLAYGIAVLATVHYLLQTKADIGGPALAFGVLAWLLAWRALPENATRSGWVLLALGFATAVLTAAAEAAWYAFATGLNWRRVLTANLDQLPAQWPDWGSDLEDWMSLGDSLRPSGEAFLISLALVVLAVLRQGFPAWLRRVPWRLPSRPWRVPLR